MSEKQVVHIITKLLKINLFEKLFRTMFGIEQST